MKKAKILSFLSILLLTVIMTTNTCYAKPVTVTKGPRIAYNSYIGDSAFGTSMYYVTDENAETHVLYCVNVKKAAKTSGDYEAEELNLSEQKNID